jgi:outer membrane receptor for ferrienterochelin and colicins
MRKIWRVFFLLILLLGAGPVLAQQSALHLWVGAEGQPLEGAHLRLDGAGQGAISDPAGWIRLTGLEPGTCEFHLSRMGYRSHQGRHLLPAGASDTLYLMLVPDILTLEEATVTAGRGAWNGSQGPVIVSRISPELLRNTQSVNLAEGLNFAPGLRMENNCQNCGFNQVRMNGLAGPYSQILINSRPVFSAMAGVYGLEMLPATMIDRVEVLRGAGSVLYGGNAIAGTINILTRQPNHNHFEAGIHQAFTGLQRPDRIVDLYGARARKDGSAGVNFFGYHRQRAPWDANGDGFSELTLLENLSLGAEGFLRLRPRQTLRINAYHIREFRRGGHRFDLPPHQTELSEQLDHRIYGLQASLERQSSDYRHHSTLYGSIQHLDRDSYYGAGGRILGPGDSLTDSDLLALRAYGKSRDLAGVLGLQHRWQWRPGLDLLAGAEAPFNLAEDAMPGYGRSIRQFSISPGVFAQVEARLPLGLLLQAGGRADGVILKGRYVLGDYRDRQSRFLPVVVPRLALLYPVNPRWKARLSLARGYRAPQAFDEDLHIETAGGLVRFIRLDPNLVAERSASLNASISRQTYGGGWRSLLVLEGFHTRLDDAFVLSDPQPLPGGISVITKRNGSGAVVQGINAEANLSRDRAWSLQSGFTLQSARYRVAETLWEAEDPGDERPAIRTNRLLRTPMAYGYYSLSLQPGPAWSINVSGVYTGPMDLPRLLDPGDGYTEIRRSPSFFEQHLRVSYTRETGKGPVLTFHAGVHNILDQFQRDLDRGALRDSGYVYGPARPRSLYAGIRFHFDGDKPDRHQPGR